jgi:ABC-type branched-subunit amino acid transport system permease subunit
MSIPILTWVQGIPADMPNCAQYPAACASYNAQHSATPWIVLAAVIILAAVLAVAVTLVITRQRRGRPQGPPPPSWPGQV